MNLKEATDFIYDIPKFTVKHTVEKTKEFLEFTGFEKIGPKVIHVAGTNGKGSVCNFLKEILEAHGKKVCLFTSPHLVDIRERFYISDTDISEAMFLEAFDAVSAKIREYGEDEYYPSFFEFLFFMGMYMFGTVAEKTDVVILETGLGGRLDATNCISHKDLCVITKMGYDHTEYLGDTIELIAAEKAGIIRPGVPVVYVDMEASSVFEDKAKECNAECIPLSDSLIENIKTTYNSVSFVLSGRKLKNVRVNLNAGAKFQVMNAREAFLAAEILLGDSIDANAVSAAFAKAFWPARMQEIKPNVFLDGAHNPCGMEAFLESVSCEPSVLLFSAVKDKDVAGVTKLICDKACFEKIVVTRIPGYRAMDENDIANLFLKYDNAPEVIIEPDIKKAYAIATGFGKRTYIAGSLYLAGEILAIVDNIDMRE